MRPPASTLQCCDRRTVDDALYPAILANKDIGRNPRNFSRCPLFAGLSHLTNNHPSPLAGEVGWGVAPSLGSNRTSALRDPPTPTLPRKGGGGKSSYARAIP